MLLANIIFHAFEAAYLSWLFVFPLAVVALAFESAILFAFNPNTSLARLVACVILMNAASYVLGYWLAPKLFVESGLVVVNPDEHGYGVLDRGPTWLSQARYGFLQAALISISVESAALLPFRRWMSLSHILLPVVLANIASYTLLCIVFVNQVGNWSYHIP